MAKRRAGAGSITKEFPLRALDRTIQAVRPGMTYQQLREVAGRITSDAIPALLANRWLRLRDDGTIVFDQFLSLADSEGLDSPRIRKIMYFVWMFREPRLRRFVCEVVSGRDGHWRVSNLVRKSNSAFFEEFFGTEAAVKARSNFEQFCLEAGIFDRAAGAIHLEINDGWLTDAMSVAAQHVRNPAVRRSMVNAPAEYLISNGWNALANATVEELRGFSGTVLAETEPLEDEEIRNRGVSQSRPWNRTRPTHSGRRSATIVVDMVARERANSAHFMLEQITAAAARASGYDPQYNDQIDIHFAVTGGQVLTEIKSCHAGNIHSQVRKGISQLLEYEFVYRFILGEVVMRLLVTEIRPAGEEAWLLDYLESLHILLAWKEPGESRLVTCMAIPPALTAVLTHVD